MLKRACKHATQLSFGVSNMNRMNTILIVLVIALALPIGGMTIAGQSSLELLKKYAEDYDPIPPQGGHIPFLPVPPDDIKKILKEAPVTDELSKYVCLIILKLYRYQMENSNLAHDLRRSAPIPDGKHPNAILSTFARIARIDMDYIYNGEQVHPSMAQDWVGIHPYLNRYQPIHEELDRIRNVYDRIREGIYRSIEDGSYFRNKK